MLRAHEGGWFVADIDEALLYVAVRRDVYCRVALIPGILSDVMNLLVRYLQQHNTHITCHTLVVTTKNDIGTRLEWNYNLKRGLQT